MSTQRIQIRLKDPNPVFTKWLEKWYQHAKEKNSKSQTNLKTALESLKKFPLELKSGKDCYILEGFGAKLCEMIDQELKTYQNQPPSTFESDVKEVIKKVKKTASTKSKAAQKAVAQQSQPLQQVVMNSGTFRIILLVDTAETSGKSKKDLDDTRLFLESFKVQYEVRRLSVGDFAWICRDSSGNEFVIPYILERKRMDDLAGSIKDGRYSEQKYRLKSSGIPNLIYLIEDHKNNDRLGLPLGNLKQAAVNTQIHSGFQIKHTRTHKDSMMYIKELPNLNKQDYVIGMLSFSDFQNSTAKNKGIQIREIFIKQLIQLKFLTTEKAIAITEIYPTPRALLEAYDECDSIEEKERRCLTVRDLNTITASYNT
uniref:Crossover junction endonuclease MUS81 n=1 Tax=Megaselia scalaris TaxID=36166 RepID=T1GFA5_MEGSC